LFHVNKALAIDDQNPGYWKRYATINEAMDFFEEAEYGYRKAVELGDFELDTWLFWVGILQHLGEYEHAVHTLLQASEYYPEEQEIEYRLAGLYFIQNLSEKGLFHLANGLRLNYQNHTLIATLFPSIWEQTVVQNYISKFEK
jgi:tetratricopeptide (TPR) repeat protein